MGAAYLSGKHGKGHDADGREDIVAYKTIGSLMFRSVVEPTDSHDKQDGGQCGHRDDGDCGQ